MSGIKVLICEYSRIHHQDLYDGFKSALISAGYEPEIQMCADIDAAIEFLDGGDYDLLITDLSFNKHYSIGLDFIVKVKNEHPDLCVVACSTNSPSFDEVTSKQPSFDLYIPKRSILSPDEDELKNSGLKIKRFIGKLSGFRLRVKKSNASPLLVSGVKISEAELKSLVAQVLRELQDTDTRFRPIEVTATPIAGGYSGSLVLLLNLSGTDPNLQFVKTIIKVSLADWTIDEISNFKKYAKWMLPSNKRVELVGEGRTKLFGAIAYAFVFGGETEFDNLTSFLEKGDTIKVKEYLETIFDEDLVSFYKSTSYQSSIGVSPHYRKRYFPDNRHKETKDIFERILLTKFQAKIMANAFEIKGVVYPDPFRTLLFGKDKKFKLSICHGDFNSNNIICSTDAQVAYIDFQDTGPGHVLQDFTSLESSIRLNWNRTTPVRKSKNLAFTLLNREKNLAQLKFNNRQKGGYDNMCLYLRELAFQRFPDLEPWEYPYSIAALSLKLLRIPDLSDYQLCKLCACALIATRELETSMNGR